MDVNELRARMRARAPRPSGRWYEIRNQDTDVAVVRIYDFIDPWGVTAQDFVDDLDRISSSTIEVQINSGGGDVWDATAIHNALRTHPARIVTRVDGIAASAASLIAQAGDHRVMLDAAQMMIHEAWSVVIGSARDMRTFADLLDKQNEIIAALYAARSGGDKDRFLELMADETWFTAAEAVEAGLADEVVVPPRKDGSAARLRDEIRSTLTDDDVRRELGLPPLQAPPAGEQGEDTETAVLKALRDLI